MLCDQALSRGHTLTLKHFIFDEASNIIGVGVGTAGCRVASKISGFKTGIHHFYYLSCDENDLRGLTESIYIPLTHLRREPAAVRGVGVKHLNKIREVVKGAKLTLIISGLGGATGSGLAPLVAEAAKEQGSPVLAVAIMPSDFEHSKLFYSSIALRHLSRACDHVIVIDNNDFTQTLSDKPILDVYEEINERIAFALSRLLGAFEKEDYPVGLDKTITASIKDRFTLLALSDRVDVLEAVGEAVASIYKKADPAEAESALLYLSGSKNLLAGEVEDSVKHLATLLRDGGVRVECGFSTCGYSKVTSVVLVSGFKKIKLANYDVLDSIFGAERTLDSGPECTLDLPFNNITQLE
jgi:cell division GTPase FtsZ